MNKAPKWFVPVAVLALIWNVLGCAAYLYDVTLSQEALKQMTEAQQAMYAARPAWSVSATAVAVWFGALGCVGLIMKRRWSLPVLAISLLGVVVQDIALFVLSGAGGAGGTAVFVFQGIVLVVSILLVLMSRHGIRHNWMK